MIDAFVIGTLFAMGIFIGVGGIAFIKYEMKKPY